jgi:hypothetical protein
VTTRRLYESKELRRKSVFRSTIKGLGRRRDDVVIHWSHARVVRGSVLRLGLSLLQPLQIEIQNGALRKTRLFKQRKGSILWYSCRRHHLETTSLFVRF